MILPSIHDPADLKELSPVECDRLANEIRSFLVDAVSKTGGHLGPNLGVVELTIALHRVFTTPDDTLIFDTGHQAYVHKLLTGRMDDFTTLRQHGGLSGYPSRKESPHDFMENSHASTGLSYACAVAVAKRMSGDSGKTVCVVGDGSLTGGMSYEALNNIGQLKPEMVIILNDNGRSYAPTVGGIADHFSHLRLSPRYEAAKDAAGSVLRGLPVVGPSAYMTAKRMKDSLKQLVAPMSVFETLGLKYAGPIDGHDICELERALHDAMLYRGPVVIHIVTEKGHGYGPALDDEIDKFHGVSRFDPANGAPYPAAKRSWTDLFGDTLLEVASHDDRVVAITAAMASSTGLLPFAKAYPDRFFDVGIAEQHAVAFATGLALQGYRPVVAIYSSFLQRAFDQLICDTALHEAPITFVLDRAGITGDDGASHHGIFDLAYLRMVPGFTVASPSTPDALGDLLATSLAGNKPFAIRFPRGTAPMDTTRAPEIHTPGTFHISRKGDDVVIVALGKMVHVANEAAGLLAKNNVHATVIDLQYVKPLGDALSEILATYPLVVTVEDGIRDGGMGSAVTEVLIDKGITVPVLRLGLPDQFIEHGAQQLLLEKYGLTPEGIVNTVILHLKDAQGSHLPSAPHVR
ncbi:MAG: 1-deoxy-D-xylulose-5-phosphate synthase [Candidatus Dormibacteria bacterium]